MVFVNHARNWRAIIIVHMYILSSILVRAVSGAEITCSERLQRNTASSFAQGHCCSPAYTKGTSRKVNANVLLLTHNFEGFGVLTPTSVSLNLFVPKFYFQLNTTSGC
jgi:hypothetical protein